MVRKLAIIAVMALAGTASSAQDTPEKLSKGEAQVKQLLTLMDKDKSGKVSREEFMNFFAAEFERLDVNKAGELDVTELTHLQVRTSKHAGGTGSK